PRGTGRGGSSARPARQASGARGWAAPAPTTTTAPTVPAAPTPTATRSVLAAASCTPPPAPAGARFAPVAPPPGARGSRPRARERVLRPRTGLRTRPACSNNRSNKVSLEAPTDTYASPPRLAITGCQQDARAP